LRIEKLNELLDLYLLYLSHAGMGFSPLDRCSADLQISYVISVIAPDFDYYAIIGNRDRRFDRKPGFHLSPVSPRITWRTYSRLVLGANTHHSTRRNERAQER
jgi:hypothetical protein